MARFFWVFLGFCCVLLPLSAAQAVERSAWGGAERWVGHFPAEALASGRGFFETPEVAERLNGLLLPGKMAELQDYTDAEPVAQVEHYLVARRCNRGNCAAGMSTVIVDEASNNMWVVLTSSEGGEFSRCWTGTEHFAALPGTLQASFVSE